MAHRKNSNFVSDATVADAVRKTFDSRPSDISLKDRPSFGVRGNLDDSHVNNCREEVGTQSGDSLFAENCGFDQFRP